MRVLRSRCGCCALALIVCLTLSAVPVIAQVDTGTIAGTVKDSSGGVLPGATVTITHEGQAFALTGVTGQDGGYVFTPVRTGSYTIRIEFPGFRTTEQRGIPVGIGQQARIDFTLETGTLSEELVVTAASPLLQTGTGTVGARQVREPREHARSTAATTRPSRGSPRASCRRSQARGRRSCSRRTVSGRRRTTTCSTASTTTRATSTS